MPDLQDRPRANGNALSDATLHIARDMILLALDATEPLRVSRRNRIEARAALVEALDLLEGEA